ncbi:MAG: hypothetical protein CMP48_18935 [Rickettsiales bacterium]|nr:hypothetical protein [Rickettsiales bacterium]
MTTFIGVDTYYANGDTGVTWFYNDLKLTEEAFKNRLDHITNNEQREIIQNDDGQYVFYDSQQRNENERHDFYGTFVWSDTSGGYPWDKEDIPVDELPEYGIIPVSEFLNQLLKLIQ